MSATVDASRTIPLPTLVDRLEALAEALDAATHDERVAWMRGLGAREQRALYELAKGTELRAEHFVEAQGVVIHEGKNGLPAFSWFQKRFARVGDEIVGYNHNGALATWFGGPGHFVVYDSPKVPGEVWIDYRRVPKARHPEFPDLRGNDAGLGPKVVYGNMIDVVRRVSRHVSIGDSFTGEELKPKKVTFVLCRP